MRSYQKVLIGLISFLAFIIILAGLPIAALSNLITSPSTVSAILAEEEIYESLKKSANEIPLGEVGASEDAAEAQEADFDPEALSAIIERYFSFEFYQRAINEIVPAIYSWLEGESENLEFSVSITDDRQEFKNFILDIFTERYRNLPVCTNPPTSGDFNPFESKCRLTSVTEGEVRAALEAKLGEEELDQFFTSATLSSDEFVQDMEPADAANLKRAYKVVDNLGLIIISILVGLLGFAALTVHNRAKIAKILGRIMLVPSVLLLLASTIIWFAQAAIIRAALPQNLAADSPAQYQVLNTLTREFLTKFNMRILLSTLIITLLAIGLLIFSKLKYPKIAAKT